MATFKDGAGVQSALTDIIKTSEKELFLISPYLKIPVQIKNYINSIDNNNIPITVIYRSDFKLNDDDLAFFSGLTNLKLYFCENLHTKCYLNEKEGLITSLNLHEYSQTHNWEMGIRFSSQNDRDIYSDVKKELVHLQSQCKPHTLKKKIPDIKQHEHKDYSHGTAQKPAYKPKEAPNKGLFNSIVDSVMGEEAYCVRCGHSMSKYNLQKPLCDRCYPIWADHKNIKYPEKFCHYCGEQKQNISFEKPTCIGCFKRLYKKS
jgi:hypothetical protein